MTSRTRCTSRIVENQNETVVARSKATRLFHKASGAGGSAGFRGYLYQVEVSVWTALDLVVAKGMASEVELEPCSQEDVEAVLVETDPGKPLVYTQVAGRLLVIQAKLANRTEWSHSAIARLLAHGGPGRRSAKERLREPNIEYVLVTSAPLTGVARTLSARDFAQKMEPESMAVSIAKPLPPDAPGRVKVMESFDEDRITAKLRELLVDAMNVPKPNRDACLDELRQAARSKMTGLASRKWTRAELEDVIVRHGGFIATSPDLTHYVKPENWSAFSDMLQQEHAVVIYGCSGTGKTMTAAALWDQLHASGTGYSRVAAESPSIVHATPRNQPVVFDVEDPWGRYRFEPNQEQWLDKLPDLLRTAGPNRKFIVTTREDVMDDAGVRERTKRWRVALQPEHYSRNKKRQLFMNRLHAVERNLQLTVADSREHILGQLATPNEIDRFFANLRDPADSDDTPPQQIGRALERARYDSIELTIAQQIRARGAQHWAVVVWALLGARKKLTRQALVDVHVRLADAHQEFEAGLESFLNFFVSGHSLRQRGTLVSYYHPRAEAAFAAIVHEESVRSAKLLAKLLDALTQLDSAESWWNETAAYVLAFSSRSELLQIRPNARVRSRIDNWVSHEVDRSEGEVFREVLRVASAAGSVDCLAAEFARFVLDVESVEWFRSNRARREQPEPDSAWFARMSADTSMRALCCKWVESGLPFASEHYTVRLVERLRGIEPKIAASFIRAAAIVVPQGVSSNIDVIAAGAVLDLDGVESVVLKALQIWDSPSDWAQTFAKIQDGEYSESYSEHLSESVGEEGYSAGEFLEAYVRALRRQRGWTAVASHPKAKCLGRWWARELLNDDEREPADPEEIKSLVELGIDSDFEALVWRVAERAWNENLRGRLTQRLSQAINDKEVRASIARCLAQHSKAQFGDVATRLLESGDVLRLLVLFEDLAYSCSSKKGQERLYSDLLAWTQCLPRHVDELATPFLLSVNDRSWTLTDVTSQLIADAMAKTEAELQLKIQIALQAGIDARGAVEQLVACATENDIAQFGIKTAIHLQMYELVEGAVAHPRGVVRAEAFKYLAERCEGVLPSQLLELYADKSRYVRDAVIEVLANDPRPEYASQLEALAEDTWSDQDVHFGYHDSDRRPIARKAAIALASLGPMDDDTVNRLVKVASKSSDPEHRTLVLQSVARQCSPDMHARLLRHALGTELAAMGRAIAHALVCAAEVLNSDLLRSLNANQLLRSEPSMAALLIVLLALIGPVIAIDKVIGVLAVNPHRKVLLVLLAKVTQDTFPNAAAQIVTQLPTRHAAREYLSRSKRLPSGSLDDLGDAVTVREVESWLAAIDKA